MNNKLPELRAIVPGGRGRLAVANRMRSQPQVGPVRSSTAADPPQSAHCYSCQESPMASRSRLFTAAAVFAICLGGLGANTHRASASLPDTFSSLAGRWSGKGTVNPASGPAERFNCVVTYIPQGSSRTRLRQNLRCKSENYRLDAATHLELRG